MSIFSPNTGPCGIFGPLGCGAGGMTQAVTFVRAASLLHGTAPVQNTAGEVLLSFVTLGPYTLDVQPLPAGFTRMVAGQLIKVDVQMFGLGVVNIQEGDRCTLDGMRLEVTNALQYGQDHIEIECQQLGR